jgi:hypothetical protein
MNCSEWHCNYGTTATHRNLISYAGCRQVVTPSTLQQHTHCTCNATMRRVKDLLLPWKINECYISLCTRASARSRRCVHERVQPCLSSMQRVYAILCHPSSIGLHHTFRHYLLNGTIFRGGGGEATEHEMCFDFLYNFLSKTFLILRIIQRKRLQVKYRYSCRILIKLAFLRNISKKLKT